ncbi:hypothetical protein L2725_21380 [Shewanella corallii]|uniref:LPP20 lipoprotein n=1 Tax=Shewanella corallii TaxID=560080 RepID=A0ABT0NEJ7_9GAMM|nr:hypothetical protein [Shewanella corallii]MCL2916291.1 hypothetical protein [Shewanella corallii]
MKKILLLAAIFGLAGCNSTSKTQSEPLAENDAIPDWVLMPVSERGLASSSCVAWSGNMTVDRAQAIAAARADLTQQIKVKSSVMDKLYSRKTQADGQSNSGGSFEQVSKQVAEQSLAGAKATKVAFARLDNQKQLCALVVMENTKETFDNLVQASGRQLDPTSEAALYEEFRAQKAMESLEAELEKLNKKSL